MSYDLNRCPQTVDEARDYFFALIGRSIGSNANDWYDVLLKRYDWKGTLMTIPRGVGPGIKQLPDAPFFGITQQMGTPGNPQARVFLPSNNPDPLNYYTRCMQYIADKEGGVHGTDFVWAWFLAGPENSYDPVLPANGGGGGTTPPPSNDLSERVKTLERQVEVLIARDEKFNERITTLENAPPPSNSGITMDQLREVLAKTYADGRTDPTGNTFTRHSHTAKLRLVIEP